MAGNDMAAWRRQNSDVITIEIKLVDGSTLRGTMLLQREKSLKDTFSSGDPFVEFDCMVNGEIVLAKTGIAVIRQIKKGATDVLDRRMKALEKTDAFGVLKLAQTTDREKIREAYLKQTRLYHPDRFAGAELPPEVSEYINAMTRRINNAYSELVLLLEATEADPKATKAKAA